MDVKYCMMLLLMILSENLAAILETRVNSIEPREGSRGGQVRLTIFGQGFAEGGQFKMPGDEGGNEVWLVSSTHVYPCTFDTDEATQTMMICYTGAMVEGDYGIRVSVDGEAVPINKLCGGNFWTCGHYVRWYVTPEIKILDTVAGKPGSMVSFWGRLITSVVDSTVGESTNGNLASLRRVYIGGQLCQLRKEGSDELYGVTLDNSGTSDHGWLNCKIQGLSVANRNISFILTDKYGRSITHKYIYREAGNTQLYMHQTYAEVSSVAPAAGSTSGGTKLQVHGNYFDPTPGATRVFTGSQECTVTSVSDNLIECVTGADPQDVQHGGGRGITREVWNATNKPYDLFNEVQSFTADTPGYWTDSYDEFGWYLMDALDRYNTRVRTWFVAPRDSNYTFYLASDDAGKVIAKHDPADKDIVFTLACPKYCNGNFHFEEIYRYRYTHFPETQISQKVSLKKGQRLYLEAIHHDAASHSALAVGVKIHNTTYNEQHALHAHNEVQVVKITTPMALYKQTLKLEAWTTGSTVNEVQTVRVTTPSPESAADFTYRLGLHGAMTESLRFGLSAADMMQKLNQMAALQPDRVTVTRTDITGGHEYSVTFNSDRGDLPLLSVVKSSADLSVIVMEQAKGAPSGNNLYLDVAGTPTPAISKSASQQQMEEGLMKVLGAQCPSIIDNPSWTSRAFYWGMEPHETDYWRFEGDLDWENGAFCGRYSYHNPNYVYRTHSAHNTQPVDLNIYPYMCFAYRGVLKQEVKIRYDWQRLNLGSRSNQDVLPVTFNNDKRWHYQCINMKQLLSAYRTDGSNFIMYHFQIYPLGPRDDFWIDNVLISKMSVLQTPEEAVEMRLPPATLEGGLIKQIRVNRTGEGVFDLEVISTNCAVNIPLIKAAYGLCSSTPLECRNNNWPGSSKTVSSLVQAASPPVAGSFDITYFNTTLTIPATIKAEDFAARLMAIGGMGDMEVTLEGNCSHQEWNIAFLSRPGDQDPPVFSSSGLRDFTEASLYTKVEGGFKYDRIPGEFLQHVHSTPQVNVFVNGIPSQCEGVCSYTYSNDQTPTVTSISPTSGSGLTLTITGQNLGENANSAWQESSVMLGENSCTITSHTDTSVQCSVGTWTYGEYKVELTVKGKGLAAHSGGEKIFTVDGAITSISPTSAPSNGGTLLTISGSGLGSVRGVSVDNQACTVVSSDDVTVACMLPAKQDATAVDTGVDVALDMDGHTLTSGTRFSYTTPTTLPTITDVAPTSLSVIGGETVTIAGTNFGATQHAAAYVTLGGTSVTVGSWSDTSIEVTAPSLDPGAHDVIVNTGVNGFAKPGSGVSTSINIALSVTNIFPAKGSLYGGTRVTISGEGFPANSALIEARFGDVNCDVRESEANRIICLLDRTRRVRRVTNQGVSREFGPGYSWEPAILDAVVGDVVHWRWTSPDLLQDLAFRIIQTESPDTEQAKAGGFTSADAGTPNGWYQHEFNTAGDFYYTSGPVDPAEKIIMQGVIHVRDRSPASLAQLNLTVAGREAEYLTQSGTSDPTDTSECAQPVSPIPISGCTVAEPDAPDNTKFYFTFWECLTPTISAVSPSEGIAGQVLTLTGTGFQADDKQCRNEVLLNEEYKCTPTTATVSSVACQIDHKNSMPTYQGLHVSLRVNNLGYAKPGAGRDLLYVFKPSVTDLSPVTGSLRGGTELTLTGAGFTTAEATSVMLSSGLQCDISAVTYTQIICITQDSMTSRKRRAAAPFTVSINGAPIECLSCDYEYSAVATPTVTSVSPSTFSGASNTLTIQGTKFTVVSEVTVIIGSQSCEVSKVTETQITCDIGYVVAGRQPVSVVVAGLGKADGDVMVTVETHIASVTPNTGSVNGGTTVTVIGGGFAVSSTTVKLGGVICGIVKMTLSSVTFVTRAHAAGAVDLGVTSNLQAFPAQSFSYSSAATPVISAVTPTSGTGGQTLTVTGTGFSTSNDDNYIYIGAALCNVTSSTATSVECTLPYIAARNHAVTMVVGGKGNATSNATFTALLNLDSVSPNQGSLAGGLSVTLSGAGFDGNDMSVAICGQSCELTDGTTSSKAVCVTPHISGTTDKVCNVTVTVHGITKQISSGFTYRSSLTPEVTSVSPQRGGTAGGTTVTITGSGFAASGNTVKIGGAACDIGSEAATRIVCTTNSVARSVRTRVDVVIPAKGSAFLKSGDFYYVDAWSSIATWGNTRLPEAGDFVVIQDGQSVLLDVDTPVLKILLIKGGQLIFDDEQDNLKLNAETILITEGGALQIGSREKPYTNKATIELYGHSRSQELPLYGTKVLAVRNGTLDLHGRPTHVTWTLLTSTVNAGGETVTLQTPVEWQIGDEIVIATTGHRHSQQESEVRTITSISADKRTLTLDSPLEYNHISVSETINGIKVETRGEVALLSHNVVVRGNDDPDWHDNIEACEDGFDTGEFSTQTCFQGRFGDEIGSSQFGAHIFISSSQPGTEAAIARIEYTEITYAGQAFRLARYPIHFHLQGAASTSYVRGCSIHHTFNRAINIHGTHGLLVEHNVLYDIMGGALFLEDGIETGNVIQYNIGIFVKSSTSLLNDDITPAAYWVTNPNNTVLHNHAAGGTHFGFWYRMHKYPDGPSYTTAYCPQNVPVKEFRNNTVHSQGWFGLWIFQEYFPHLEGRCDGPETPAKFYDFYSWNNEKGAEWVNCGPMQFINFNMFNNEKAGIEMKKVTTTKPFMSDGPVVRDSLIVGHLGITADAEYCTNRGLVLPFFSGLSVSNVTFINFDRESCVTLGVTEVQGTCSHFCGGFQYRFKQITYVNAPHKAKFRWTHEGVLVDVDGSLTGGSAGRSVVPRTNLLPPTCTKAPDFSRGPIEGYLCDTSVRFMRFSFNNVNPPSLMFKNLVVVNQHGTDVSPFADKRVTHKKGWMVMLVQGVAHSMYFENGGQITNISYTGAYELKEKEYVIMSTNMSKKPDIVKVYEGQDKQGSDTPLSSGSNKDGDWYFNTEENIVQYMVSYSSSSARKKRAAVSNFDPASGVQSKNVVFQAVQCYYENCIPPVGADNIPPPLDRPSNALYWSMPDADWRTLVGVPKPRDDQDVVIPKDKWIVGDERLPVFRQLNITGVLELEYKLNPATQKPHNFDITADLIFIHGGRFIIGWPDNGVTDRRFRGSAKIILRGSLATQPYQYPEGMVGPPIGTKAIAVFGAFEAWGIPHALTWTRLSANAAVGATVIKLRDAVDWSVGDKVVVTSSAFTANQTEVVSITAISSDKLSLTISPALQYHHAGKQYSITQDSIEIHYDMAAEVGLLSHNIKITSEVTAGLTTQSFGVRVLVGLLQQGETSYTGYARLDNVEFTQAGQEGFTSPYDPRHQLTYLDVGPVTDIKPSSVTACSFTEGFSPAIAVYGTSKLNIENNVIYHTVGEGIIVAGEEISLLSNLVTLSLWPGAYQDRLEQFNHDFPGAIDISKARGVTMKRNVVAGAERSAYKLYNRPCPITDSAVDVWQDNVAHSVLTGVLMFPDQAQSGQCAYVPNFYVYKAWDFGIYLQTVPSLKISNFLSVDNGLGVYTMVIEPSAVKHLREDKYVKIQRSVFVGKSPDYNCSDVPDMEDPNFKFSDEARCPRSASQHYGMTWGTFSQGSNHAPEKPWINIMAYGSIGGLTLLQDSVFAGFGSSCNQRDYMIITPPFNDDAIHPMKTSNITVINTDAESQILIHRPRIGKINPSDCVDMDCDGLKKALIKSLDGSWLGTPLPTAVVPQSEWEWDGDPRRGLGDYRIPKELLTDLQGKRVPVDQVVKYRGVIRNSECENLTATWHGYKCHGLDYEMLIIESMDKDTETRRISPVAVLSQPDGYLDLVNGPQDHGWCDGYTCQQRLSTFNVLVATDHEFHVYFTGTSPQKLRLHLLNSTPQQGVLLAIHYSDPQRLDVYLNHAFIKPKNAYENPDGQMVYNKPTTSGEFIPNYSDNSGTNWFDSVKKLLYVLVRGPGAVDIMTSPLVVVSFSLPALTVDEFFDGKQIVNNLAAFLGIPPNRIRVVNIVRESGTRRRRATGDPVVIEIEISSPPQESVTLDDNGDDVTMEGTRSELLQISEKLVLEVQSGQIGETLNTTILSTSIEEPLPSTDDEAWRDRLASAGTKEILIPDHIEVVQQGRSGSEGAPFSEHISVVMLDASGQRVELLGSSVNPWKMTANLTLGAKSDPRATLLGNTTVGFRMGCVNFTTLAISHSGEDYMITIRGTYPSSSSKFSATVGPFSVSPRKLEVNITSQPVTVTKGQNFSIVVDVIDPATQSRPDDITWKGHTWTCEVSVEAGWGYTGAVSTETSYTVPADGRLLIQGLSLSQVGRAFLKIHVYSSPNEFDLRTTSAAINVEPASSLGWISTYKKSIKVRFDMDYDGLDPEKKSQLASVVKNKLAVVSDVVISDIIISKGSVLVEFVLASGDRYTLETAADTITVEVKSGSFTVTLAGQSYTADSIIWINGQEQQDDPVSTAKDGGLSDGEIAAIVICVTIVVIAIVILLVYFLCVKNKKSEERWATRNVRASESSLASNNKVHPQTQVA